MGGLQRTRESQHLVLETLNPSIMLKCTRLCLFYSKARRKRHGAGRSLLKRRSSPKIGNRWSLEGILITSFVLIRFDLTRAHKL